MRSRQFLVLVILVAVVALGALYYLLQNPAAETGTAAAGPFQLSAAARAPGEAAPVFSVGEGTPVSFRLTPEADGALHIHGLSKVTVLRAGQEATMSFVADRAGRFPIEMHAGEGEGVEVGVLEVQPR